MNAFRTTLVSACLAIATCSSFAQEAMKKDAMAKDDMMKKEMTMKDCKDHMAMAKKDTMKKDDAMMKKDATCADMMKKGSAASGAMSK